jgi:hypothetical protein
MTDKELIKSLKICATFDGRCEDCPAYKLDNLPTVRCNNLIIELAADRLEALADQLHYAQAERDVVTQRMIALEIERATKEDTE